MLFVASLFMRLLPLIDPPEDIKIHLVVVCMAPSFYISVAMYQEHFKWILSRALYSQRG